MAKKYQPQNQPVSDQELENALDDAPDTSDYEDEELMEEAPKPPALPLPFTAQELAAQARHAKCLITAKENPAHKSIMGPVIDNHKAWIKATLKGAEAPDADKRFVKDSLKHLRKAYGVG